jgi:ACS family allantoate permease-like MFS transporter
MPAMMALYLIQFMDKTTLGEIHPTREERGTDTQSAGNSVLLGVKQANHLTTAQYNVLSSIFYVSYLVFEWPQVGSSLPRQILIEY